MNKPANDAFEYMTAEFVSDDFNPALFRARIKQCMNRRGWRQSDLADKTEQTQDAVSRVMTGRVRRPAAKFIEACAKAFEVEIPWLMGAKETRTPVPIAMKAKPAPVAAPARAAEKADAKIESIPVVGILEDGVFRQKPAVFDVKALPHLLSPRHPRFANFSHFAFEAGDNSMEQAGIAKGDFIICVDFIAADVPLTQGILVVTEQIIGDGNLKERTLKQVEKFPDKILLQSRSANPAHRSVTMRNGISEDPSGVRIVALAVSAVKNLYGV